MVPTSHKPGIDQRELADWLAVDIKDAKRIVRRLEQQGLIEKVPNAGLQLLQGSRLPEPEWKFVRGRALA